MLRSNRRRALAQAGYPFVTALLLLGVRGRRTAPRIGGARSPTPLAAVAAPSRLADRGAPDPAESTWVPTEATYERIGLPGDLWVATATPS